MFWSADGRAIPVEWWSHPIRANGEAEGSVVAFIDISKRKCAEREIRNYRDNLEKLVAERTEALESFSYSVSHDLRSPLRSINGFSQLLLEDQDESLNEEGREYLTRIMAASRRMGQLIDDLLHLSRLSRHGMKIQEVDLSQLAMEVVESLKQQAPERTVDVIVRPAMSVTGDCCASCWRICWAMPGNTPVKGTVHASSSAAR
jgi:light-regulated signal transduction histidine kinase (bacteriophytochrome)